MCVCVCARARGSYVYLHKVYIHPTYSHACTCMCTCMVHVDMYCARMRFSVCVLPAVPPGGGRVCTYLYACLYMHVDNRGHQLLLVMKCYACGVGRVECVWRHARARIEGPLWFLHPPCPPRLHLPLYHSALSLFLSLSPPSPALPSLDKQGLECSLTIPASITLDSYLKDRIASFYSAHRTWPLETKQPQLSGHHCCHYLNIILVVTPGPPRPTHEHIFTKHQHIFNTINV